MLEIPELKFYFVHIHKNAGRATEQFLRKVSLSLDIQGVEANSHGGQSVHGHATSWMLCNRFPEMKEWRSAATIRDPLQRLLSAYYWIKGKPAGSEGLNETDLSTVTSFEGFVDKIHDCWSAVNVGNKEVYSAPNARVKFTPEQFVYPDQTSYLVGDDGGIVVDAMIRQEYLDTELPAFVANLFGDVPASLPRLDLVGPSEKMMTAADVDRQAIDKICEVYSRDYENLGYLKP
jgi:hypothetical protein